jgi:hypothetical protein
MLMLQSCALPPPTSEKPLPPDKAVTAPVSRPLPNDILAKAAAEPIAPFVGEGWKALFDGKSLAGWQETDFAGRGEVQLESGLIVLNMGSPFTGINRTNDLLKINYEVALDAMRVNGSDFFCALTVPVGEDCCSLIVGGWGGSLVGISSLDSMDASENETTQFRNFEQGRWYRVRLRVTKGRIEAWIDKDKVVDVVTTAMRVSVRPGDIELSKPFGLASWTTTAAYRAIQIRPVTGPADPVKDR